MTYLVDTCVLSEARRRSRFALDWFAGVPDASVLVSVITFGEINKVIEMRARTDRRAAASLRSWLLRMQDNHADRVLPIDGEIALAWGRLMAQRSRSVPDALIAATALVHRKIVVTRNVIDFAGTGVDIVDPWAD